MTGDGVKVRVPFLGKEVGVLICPPNGDGVKVRRDDGVYELLSVRSVPCLTPRPDESSLLAAGDIVDILSVDHCRMFGLMRDDLAADIALDFLSLWDLFTFSANCRPIASLNEKEKEFLNLVVD